MKIKTASHLHLSSFIPDSKNLIVANEKVSTHSGAGTIIVPKIGPSG